MGQAGDILSKAAVADVDVSNTLNIGEQVYEWVANATLPSNLCLYLRSEQLREPAFRERLPFQPICSSSMLRFTVC